MEQISIFDFTAKEKLKIDKPIRLIELFAGIGAQAKALENLGVEFEHYRICEFDKYAVASYNAVHKTNFTTSDITQSRKRAVERSYCRPKRIMLELQQVRKRVCGEVENEVVFCFWENDL